MLKYEQIVNIQVNPRKKAFFRIFCELPAKTGSIICIKQRKLRGYSRNECCPSEGIDTVPDTFLKSYLVNVEMSVARVRALTHPAFFLCFRCWRSRNECCPCKGIDTH